jgi:hypothetical protein
VVGGGELTDRAWAQLGPLLPRNQRRGESGQEGVDQAGAEGAVERGAAQQ